MSTLTSPTTKICARCGEQKPTDEFLTNVNMRDGLHSWCRDCESVYARQRRDILGDLHPKAPHAAQANKARKRGDAIDFSRHVCEHIAWYVQRKITEFEALTHNEAPPHMTAILAIAKSMTAQHPPKQRHGRVNGNGLYKVTCRECGTAFDSRSPTRYYCDECRVTVGREKRRAQKQAWYATPQGQAYRMLERTRHNERRRKERANRPARPPIIIQCQGCGTEVEARSHNRKYCKDCAYLARVAYAKSERGKEARRRWKEQQRQTNATPA